MPDQDGFDLIRQLPHRRPFRQGRFQRLRDRVRAGTTGCVLLAGFQVHISNAVDPHELTAVIASLTGRTG